MRTKQAGLWNKTIQTSKGPWRILSGKTTLRQLFDELPSLDEEFFITISKNEHKEPESKKPDYKLSFKSTKQVKLDSPVPAPQAWSPPPVDDDIPF